MIFAYDIETYPNVFTCVIVETQSKMRWIFEVSDRVNQSFEFSTFALSLAGHRMLGFNNEHFDYPVIHRLINTGYFTADQAYNLATSVITADRNDRTYTVWESDRIIEQIDVFKIMHFDNVSKSTSLKKLEMAMRSLFVMDLPFPHGSYLQPEQIDQLIAYNCNDVSETIRFFETIESEVKFRDELTVKTGRNHTNYNDTKIGKQLFVSRLQESGIQCYANKQPRQTPRLEGIRIGETLIPVPFATPSLQTMWQKFSQTVLPPDRTKGFFTGLTAMLGDFELVFGAGGIHGSISSKTVRSDADNAIIDLDVTSYYPSLAIVNRFFPAHLSEAFCDIYADLKAQRVTYPKNSAESKMLKLALNGVYGDSNSKFSPFYDPAYTMSITINGQLQIAWLAELIVCHVPGARLLQVNTDGVTVHVPRTSLDTLDAVKTHWQTQTRLDLEQAEYTQMSIRDVNNYVAIKKDGTTKEKGAYYTTPEWHKDHSSLVVQKATIEFITKGVDPQDYIYRHPDMFDFMRHVKMRKSDALFLGQREIQRTSRYFIALHGEPLVKHMSTGGLISVDKDWRCVECNNWSDFDWHNLNRRFYVLEAEKLIRGVGLTI